MEQLITPLFSAKILVSLFLAILFIQSGLDKVFDWKGNLSWLTGHFGKSPLKGMVPMLLLTITIVECAAGFLSAAGAAMLLFTNAESMALIGIQLSALAILMLFFGQRIAKDYGGAASLVGYFLVTVFGIYLFTI